LGAILPVEAAGLGQATAGAAKASCEVPTATGTSPVACGAMGIVPAMF
jgi:hypothetical protein